MTLSLSANGSATDPHHGLSKGSLRGFKASSPSGVYPQSTNPINTMEISLTQAQQSFIPAVMPEINAPHVYFHTIDLTGDGGTVFLTVCLDHKETWVNGIMENSRYLKLKLDQGKLVCVSKGLGLPTFRKVKASTPEQVTDQVNRYISKADQ